MVKRLKRYSKKDKEGIEAKRVKERGGFGKFKEAHNKDNEIGGLLVRLD